jgi:hypothetical protein
MMWGNKDHRVDGHRGEAMKILSELKEIARLRAEER